MKIHYHEPSAQGISGKCRGNPPAWAGLPILRAAIPPWRDPYIFYESLDNMNIGRCKMVGIG
jgi:hypothetical protein